uniref:Uncharacterized protein n=1 Tax=Timema shepardi TaxID=629360 RepID=A0A7R9AWF5_TIMSH|nr:unnamed protein product [Timema shepardi]
MGRKIPGKKHRGVKDPFEQQARRDASLLKKMNGAPAHPEEQEMPASVHRIIKLKQMTKEKLKKRKTNKLQAVERAKPIMYGMTRPEKPAPVFTQFPGESEKSFLWRVDHTCKQQHQILQLLNMELTLVVVHYLYLIDQVFFGHLGLYEVMKDLMIQTVYEEVIAEAKFEKKFGVDVKRDIYTGDVIGVTKKPKDELSKMMMEGNIGKKKRELKPKNILSQVNKHERSKLKQSKKNNVEEDRFSSYQDEVKFGEVVHGPPDLTAPRKANKETNSSRPGKKALLLKSLLKPHEDTISVTPPPTLHHLLFQSLLHLFTSTHPASPAIPVTPPFHLHPPCITCFSSPSTTFSPPPTLHHLPFQSLHHLFTSTHPASPAIPVTPSVTSTFKPEHTIVGWGDDLKRHLTLGVVSLRGPVTAGPRHLLDLVTRTLVQSTHDNWSEE